MPERWLLTIVVMMMTCRGTTIAQSLISPRATALGAYDPIVNDTRDFGRNPGGLNSLTDWQFSATTYIPTSGDVNGFVFHGLTLGKRFGNHAAALQFSNGTALDVVFPAQGIIVGPEPTTVDSRLSYSEKFSAGYAYAVLPGLSLGTGIRFRREEVTDTQYELRDTVIVRLPDLVKQSDSWLLDLSVLWKPEAGLALSLAGRNILSFTGESLGEPFGRYQLADDPFVTAGVAYRITPVLTAAFEASSDKSGALGAEWGLSESIALRGGLYGSDHESPFVYGIGLGAGWSYRFLNFDASYLWFPGDGGTHSGDVPPQSFDASGITNIDLNPYTRNRLSMSVSAAFGEIRTSRIRIDGVRIMNEIYPAAKEIYSYQPFGVVTVTNVSEEPVQVKASFFVDNLMDVATESQPKYLIPGEQSEIPLTAFFDDRIERLTSASPEEATVALSSDPAGETEAQSQTRILVHGRNGWDGSAASLRYFVTPDDPAVIRYTRDVLVAGRAGGNIVDPLSEHLVNAKILFETFSGKLLYLNDPKLSSDYVQYPSETLELKGGDCDDMTVCFSSLLNSIGVSTAFVDVVPPDDPSKSHVYLLFDTGISPRDASLVSDNAKRYIVRRNPKGDETIWIPVETTAITNGFEEAWSLGALEYFEDVELRLGLIQGWVKIVDVF